MSKKVLIIEDEEKYARMVAMRLKTLGFEVIHMGEWKEGVAIAEQQKPDIILCDILLPNINGFEIVRQLKANEITKSIPVIMLSVLEDPESINLAFTAGAVDYVPKMYEGSLLIDKINKVLGIS